MSEMNKARFEFFTTCVGWGKGEDILALRESAKNITRKTFARKVRGLKELEKSLGYDRYLAMSKDRHVSYAKGKFLDKPAYYFVWSGVEFIFLKEEQ
jgi:hypothetical protein